MTDRNRFTERRNIEDEVSDLKADLSNLKGQLNSYAKSSELPDWQHYATKAAVDNVVGRLDGLSNELRSYRWFIGLLVVLFAAALAGMFGWVPTP